LPHAERRKNVGKRETHRIDAARPEKDRGGEGSWLISPSDLVGEGKETNRGIESSRKRERRGAKKKSSSHQRGR